VAEHFAEERLALQPLTRRFGRAMPSLRNDPTMTYYETNRRVIHLSKAKRCLDQAGHLSATGRPSRISG
jgi:hypothetical protein